MINIKDIPRDFWIIDMGESVVRISNEEFARIDPSLALLSMRIIPVVDIFGSDTRVMRDKILHVSHSSIEVSALARQYFREYTSALDDIDPAGAEKAWGK